MDAKPAAPSWLTPRSRRGAPRVVALSASLSYLAVTTVSWTGTTCSTSPCFCIGTCTTIGSTLTSEPAAAGGCSNVTVTAIQPSYSIPAGGQIVAWRARLGGAGTTTLAFLVWRPLGGTNYQCLGEDIRTGVPRGTISEFCLTSPINVLANDVLSVRVTDVATEPIAEPAGGLVYAQISGCPSSANFGTVDPHGLAINADLCSPLVITNTETFTPAPPATSTTTAAASPPSTATGTPIPTASAQPTETHTSAPSGSATPATPASATLAYSPTATVSATSAPSATATATASATSDRTGTATPSPAATPPAGIFRVFPNPARLGAKVFVYGLRSGSSVTVWNAVGERVVTLTADAAGRARWDGQPAAAGIYVLAGTTSSGASVRRPVARIP